MPFAPESNSNLVDDPLNSEQLEQLLEPDEPRLEKIVGAAATGRVVTFETRVWASPEAPLHADRVADRRADQAYREGRWNRIKVQ